MWYRVVSVLLLAACISRAPKDTDVTAQSWAVTPQGELVRGGAKKVIANAALYGVFAVDAHNVWVAGDRGMILYSSDGGERFDAQISGVAATLHAVSFSSPAHGVIVGDGGVILSTEDGGARWRKIELDGVSADLHAVALSPSWGLAVAAGERGTLLVSHDGGRSFSRMASPTDEHIAQVALFDEGIIVTTASGNVFSVADPAE